MKQPMLAGKADLSKIQYPVLVSPKIDGIRAVVVRGEDGLPVVKSRSMKPIPNRHIQTVLAREELFHADGELVVGDVRSETCFRDSTSGVMSIEGEPDFTYFVFDRIDHCGREFHSRLMTIMDHLNQTARDARNRVQILPHKQVFNEEQLLREEERYTGQGYEGIMIRSLNGPYKQGRSTTKEGYLLKLKRWQDDEATIVGFEEEMENENISFINEVGRTSRTTHQAGMVPKGRCGSLLVRDLTTGVVFSIGSGLCDVVRTQIWNEQAAWLGRIIKYKHFPIGVKDKPRFPIYLGVRDERDM